MRALRITLILILSLGAASALHAGSITGNVRLNGAVPKPSEIQATKDQDYCGVKIPDLPPGRYVLSAWHEKAGVQNKEVVLSGEGDLTVNVEFHGK